MVFQLLRRTTTQFNLQLIYFFMTEDPTHSLKLYTFNASVCIYSYQHLSMKLSFPLETDKEQVISLALE